MISDWADYVPGHHRIRYYHDLLSKNEDIQIEAFDQGMYENRLLERLTDRNDNNNFLVSIGALGSGKSTCARHIVDKIKLSIKQNDKKECFSPIIINGIHINSIDDVQFRILRTLLDSTLDQLANIWTAGKSLTHLEGALLIALLLIDSTGCWSFRKLSHIYPRTRVYNPLAELPSPNLLESPRNFASIQKILQVYKPYITQIQNYFEALTANEELTYQSTSCALGLLCDITSDEQPKIVIVDNLDQFPTSDIQRNAKPNSNCVLLAANNHLDYYS